jgi:hypothetical protein
MKTVKEVAEELNISTQAVYKKLNQLQTELDNGEPAMVTMLLQKILCLILVTSKYPGKDVLDLMAVGFTMVQTIQKPLIGHFIIYATLHRGEGTFL